MGFALGAMLDRLQGGDQDAELPPHQEQRRRYTRTGPTLAGDMALSLVVLSAAIMKADGRVTRSELDHVRAFFQQQFGGRHAAELLRVLRDVLKREIPLAQVCMQVRQHMPHPMRLQLMHYLIGLANADGRVEPSEEAMLRRIAQAIGISDKDLGSLSAMFRRPTADSAYQILEVDPKASDEEVKKAYRRMAMKYHPDKVGHLGEEFQQAAAEKFRKVQDAYERIAQARGIK